MADAGPQIDLSTRIIECAECMLVTEHGTWGAAMTWLGLHINHVHPQAKGGYFTVLEEHE